MNAKKLYKQLKKFGANLSVDILRKVGLAHSNYRLCTPQNEKDFNYKRVKAINHFDKHSKKSDYGKSYLTRDDESDRMKRVRKRGTKALRRKLKKEAQQIIDDARE